MKEKKFFYGWVIVLAGTLLMAAIMGIGFGCPFGTVGSPIIVQKVFGQKDYAAIMGMYNAFSNIGSALAPTGNGTVFDMAGSYNPAFILWSITVVIIIGCFAFFLPSDRQEKMAAK